MLGPLGFFASGGGGGGAFELISTTVLTGTATQVNFTGVPSTYKHLQLRINARATASSEFKSMFMRFNSDTASNYSDHRLEANGSSVISTATPNNSAMIVGYIAAASTPTGAHGVSIVDILDYASSTKNKTSRALTGYAATSSRYLGLTSGNWRSTAPVTSISLQSLASDVWGVGSRFSLYGIKG